MDILIKPDLRITTDTHQWIVETRRLVDCESRWDAKTFHQTLNSAVVGLARQGIVDFGECISPEDLDGLTDRIDQSLCLLEAALVRLGHARPTRPKKGLCLHVDPDCRIIADESQWILQRRRVSRGKCKWDSKHFYQTLTKAVLDLANEYIRGLDVELPAASLNRACQAVDSISRDLINAVEQTYLSQRAQKARAPHGGRPAVNDKATLGKAPPRPETPRAVLTYISGPL